MYGIALNCKDTTGDGGGVGLSDSNTTLGYTSLLYSALDFGNYHRASCVLAC